MIKKNLNLSYKIFFTRIGSMIAFANEKELCALQFVDEGDLEKKIHIFAKKFQATVHLQKNLIIDQVEKELDLYFTGKLREFSVPIDVQGSPFQKLVWNEVRKIPFGTTKSYSEIASCINRASGHRAIGRANGANQLVIIIPCHRVIYIDNTIGGYAGGVARKQWLLHHEKHAISI